MSLLSPSQQEARRQALLAGLTERVRKALNAAELAIARPSRQTCRNAATDLKGVGLANPLHRETVGELGYELGIRLRAFGLRMSALGDLHEADEQDEAVRLPELTEAVRIRLQDELESYFPHLRQFAQQWTEDPDLDPEPATGLEFYDERIAA